MPRRGPVDGRLPFGPYPPPRLDVAASIAAIGCTPDESAGPAELPGVKEPPPAKRGRPREGEK